MLELSDGDSKVCLVDAFVYGFRAAMHLCALKVRNLSVFCLFPVKLAEVLL